MSNYILQGHKAVPEPDIMAWAKWFESANRVVKKTEVANGVEVSTVFLGIDHQFGDGDPLLFETMIFGGERDGYQDRYSTWDEALKAHEAIVKEFSHRCSFCGTLRLTQSVGRKPCKRKEIKMAKIAYTQELDDVASWFRNCGIDELTPEMVSNIILGWRPESVLDPKFRPTKRAGDQ